MTAAMHAPTAVLPQKDVVFLAADLYAFVSSSEALVSRQRMQSGVDKIHRWAADLSQRCQHLRAHVASEAASVIERAAKNLEAFKSELKNGQTGTELARRWRSLSDDYEALVAYIHKVRLHVPEGVRLGHIKPKNYYRNIFHVSSGLLGVFLYEFVFGRLGVFLVAASIVLSFFIMDLMRRWHAPFNDWFVKRIFGKISRPNEAHKIPSATWFMLSLAIGIVIFPQRAIQIGALVLAVADPVAALVGKRFGRAKIYGDKSWAGSIACMLAGFAGTAIFLLLAQPSMPLLAVLGVALGVGTAGALAELFGERIDDNFTIPLVTGAVAALLL